ncbi:MAG: hypothetical protein QOG91_173, partial [Candidatus Parcubacteria bacterium]|nr:hypothetical protein [Candidatus Parcubacteria bacterium]
MYHNSTEWRDRFIKSGALWVFD